MVQNLSWASHSARQPGPRRRGREEVTTAPEDASLNRWHCKCNDTHGFRCLEHGGDDSVLLMQGAFVDWDGARDGHVVLEGAKGRRVLSGSCLSLTQLVRDSTLSRVLW